MVTQLEQKIDRAVRLIKSTVGNQIVEVSYSGGKDSEVILELVKMARCRYRAIFKNTTIDPPGTIAHCKSKGAEIMRPPITFFRLIRKKGMPTRRCRFCCEKMKEYKVLDISVQGIRRCESNRRAARYSSDDPVICRLYGRSRAQHVNVILPILDWTDEDVEEFIKLRNIKCHPAYYRSDGSFDVTRRLGCLTCPLQGDQGLEDFEKNPRLVRATLTYLQAWWDEHPNTKSHEKFCNIFELFIHNVFFRSYSRFEKEIEQYRIEGSAMKWLENRFGISLHDLPKLHSAPAMPTRCASCARDRRGATRSERRNPRKARPGAQKKPTTIKL